MVIYDMTAKLLGEYLSLVPQVSFSTAKYLSEKISPFVRSAKYQR